MHNICLSILLIIRRTKFEIPTSTFLSYVNYSSLKRRSSLPLPRVIRMFETMYKYFQHSAQLCLLFLFFFLFFGFSWIFFFFELSFLFPLVIFLVILIIFFNLVFQSISFRVQKPKYVPWLCPDCNFEQVTLSVKWGQQYLPHSVFVKLNVKIHVKHQCCELSSSALIIHKEVI